MVKVKAMEIIVRNIKKIQSEYREHVDSYKTKIKETIRDL